MPKQKIAEKIGKKQVAILILVSILIAFLTPWYVRVNSIMVVAPPYFTYFKTGGYLLFPFWLLDPINLAQFFGKVSVFFVILFSLKLHRASLRKSLVIILAISLICQFIGHIFFTTTDQGKATAFYDHIDALHSAGETIDYNSFLVIKDEMVPELIFREAKGVYSKDEQIHTIGFKGKTVTYDYCVNVQIPGRPFGRNIEYCFNSNDTLVFFDNDM